MTLTHRVLRTFMLTTMMAFFATVSGAQNTSPPAGQDHGNRPHAAAVVDVRARIALLDERIALLASDMKMFAGELKIQTMASLLEALVERQALSDREMRPMRDMMRERMMDRSTPAPSAEMEPDMMCSPYI